MLAEQATQLPLKIVKTEEVPAPPKIKRERVLPALDLLEGHTSESIAQEEIAHAAADQVSLVAAGAQPVDDLPREGFGFAPESFFFRNRGAGTSRAVAGNPLPVAQPAPVSPRVAPGTGRRAAG